MKIGVFGGTFDPVHIGHTTLALECRHELELDKVLFVPANISPFKIDHIPVSPADRLNMLRLAIGHDPRFGICTLELDRGGVSYTVETLRELAKEYGKGSQLFFLAGADSAEGFDEWKDAGEIMKLATFVALSRPGSNLTRRPKENYRVVEMPLLKISSTMIRRRVRDGRPIECFIAPLVADYIHEEGLYLEEG